MLEALPLLRHICLLKVLRVLIAELEMTVLHRLFDPRLAAQPNNRAYALLDAPSCSNASHTDVVFLRDLFHALDDLLVNSIFPLVDERIEKLVTLCAARGSVTPGTGQGASGDGRPWDQADACILAIGNLRDGSALCFITEVVLKPTISLSSSR
jgi:hypothetical protein